jgi:hypothetical protein
MAIVVEPILTEEKLRECLAERHEQSCMDYKKKLDFQTTKDVLEFAKDVAALQSELNGGYIVVGADGQGNPVPDLARVDLDQFDESRLRSRIEKYFSGPFDLRSARHTVDGNNLVLIHVAPSLDGWCIIAQDGEYKDDASNRSKFIFRRGDVLVRRGTSSERWNHHDRDRVVRQLIARERERWRRESRDEAVQASTLEASVQGMRLSGPLTDLTWKLDSEAYDELISQLLRAQDDVPLRRLLYQLRRDAADRYRSNPDELVDILDRVTAFAAVALQFRRDDWFRDAVSCFVRIYENGFDERGYEVVTQTSVTLWLETISRVHALGALAVRLEDWSAVRFLTSRRPRGDQFRWYGSWLRHGLTMGARANMMDGDSNLIARGGNVIRRLEALRPEELADSEALTTSLCQFDVYGCLNVMGSRRSLDSGNFYPSFARYHSYRSEPAFVRLVEDERIREEVFGADKKWLAICIRELASRASIEGMRYINWMEIDNESVRSFVNENATQD